MATKDNLPTKQSRSAIIPTGEESKNPVPQPSGLGELATSTATEAEKRLEVVQRTQISSLSGAEKIKEPQDKTPKRQLPKLATRPKRYALELWVEIEICVGVYAAPKEDSYSVNFTINTLNRAYLGCTGVYLGEAGHMVAFYSRKANPKASLIHGEAVVASKTIVDIPTWMGYFARWRRKCVSISEATEIVAGCKRLEKENWRWAHWELQKRFSAMQVDSALSTTARPFQPQVTPQLSNEDDGQPVYPPRSGCSGSHPTLGLVPSSPVGRTSFSHPLSSEDEGASSDASNHDRPLRRRRGSRESWKSQSGSDSDETRSSRRRQKMKDGFSSKIQIPEFGGKKGHPNDVADTFRQWAHCITYYHDYYEDSYLMPLVVSSLKGNASEVFDWTQSITLGGTQDLSTLLQMVHEHYCGSYTLWEQRNMGENLHQGVREDATDFMIWVGTSVSNLGKDWKDQLTDEELQSLQYEVSLNGVKEEIQHILDSKIARHGWLILHQMYEAVKKYETYVARNKRIKGKSASPHTNHQRAVPQTFGYKPCFHKTTAFVASVEETTDSTPTESGPSPHDEEDHPEVEPNQEDNEGLFIPSFLEEALGGDGNLQIKMAHTMQAQEKQERRCFICQSLDHLMMDHYQGKNGKGPLQLKGPPQNKSTRETARASPPSRATSQGALPK